MVGRVAGGGDRPQPGVLLAVGGQDDGRGVHTRLRDRARQRLRPGGVVAVAVGEEDDPDPAALLGGGDHGGEVAGVVGPRVDDGARPRPVQIRVRPLQRHRPRIRRHDPKNLRMTRGIRSGHLDGPVSARLGRGGTSCTFFAATPSDGRRLSSKKVK